MKLKYRPEIDGLRAVAVLPVIFFHAGFAFLRGGYVGVDVFFVISGYLITTIIVNDLEAGTFTVRSFYERRVRRILPALVVVILACLPFAYFVMLPDQLEEFSQSVMSVMLFSSNILFWRKTGYFETATELKPLLHTWSLAVEEQYYLFFPWLLIIMRGFGKRIMLSLLALLGIASLILAQWMSAGHPAANFYLLPTRLWEILIGSLAAFYLLGRDETNAGADLPLAAKQFLSLLGLGLILYAVAAFNDQTPIPSLYTLAPTIGAALIILFASEQTLVGRILSAKFFVGIGLISYSAYLWHQPIFAFAKLMSPTPPGSAVLFALGLLALGLAYLSWKFVEKPFRDRNKFGRKQVFQFAAAASLCVVALGATGSLNHGFEDRVTANGTRFNDLMTRLRFNHGLSDTCDYGSVFMPLAECQNSDSPELAVWGDSYAMALVPGVLASNPGERIIQITKNNCGPFLGIAEVNSNHPVAEGEDCIAFNDSVIAWLKEHPNVHYVALTSEFTMFLSPYWELLKDDSLLPVDEGTVMSSVEATLSALKEMGITPVVFAPPPSTGEDMGMCLVNSAAFGMTSGCQIETGAYRAYQERILDLLGRIAPEARVVLFSDILCDSDFCNTEIDGVFIYRDWGHLSVEGSEYLGKKMNFYNLITSGAQEQ